MSAPPHFNRMRVECSMFTYILVAFRVDAIELVGKYCHSNEEYTIEFGLTIHTIVYAFISIEVVNFT